MHFIDLNWIAHQGQSEHCGWQWKSARAHQLPFGGFGCRSKGQNVINVRTANNRRSSSSSSSGVYTRTAHTIAAQQRSKIAPHNDTRYMIHNPQHTQYIIHAMHSLHCPRPYLCAFRFPCACTLYMYINHG